MKPRHLLSISALLLAACSSNDGVSRKAIIGATAVDARMRLANGVLTTAGARIFSLSSQQAASISGRAERLSAPGKFIIPAFVVEPPDWPRTPLVTREDVEERIDVDGSKVVVGIVEDQVVRETRWFDSMRKKSIVFVPQMSRLEPGSEPFRIAAENLMGLAKADVAIATLAPRRDPEEIFREFEALAKAGLTPQQILTSATLNASLALGTDDFGLLLQDRRASVLVLGADPLASAANLQKIERVMIDGSWADPKRPFIQQ